MTANSAAHLPRAVAWLLLVPLLAAPIAHADHPQWGHAWSRNMVSPVTPLPNRFDLATGENHVWSIPLGSETHSSPVIAHGRILIGTNNENPRDPRHQGDRGVLFCLEEDTGRLLWQLVVPKRTEDIYFDWPRSGMSSTATFHDHRAYMVDNRGVVLALDLQGLSNGNDGPFLHENIYFTPQPTNTLAQGAPAVFTPHGTLLPNARDYQQQDPGPLDADILWFFDLSSGAGIWSHDAAHSSILVHGRHLYLNTGTGVDNTHKQIRRPDAPSLVVLDRETGTYLARDNEGIGPNIFHSTWAPPSLGTLAGQQVIFFAAGNGIVYAFEPLPQTPLAPSPSPHPLSLRCLARLDFDPDAPKTDVHRFHLNKQEGPSTFYGAPVFHENQLFVAGGGDLWWGKAAAWLKCFDVTTLPPTLRWSHPLDRHTFSTPAVHQGIAYVTDIRQNLHAVDAATGDPIWSHELQGETWASPLVADGKVYVGTRRGHFHILEASRTKNILFETRLEAPISATTVAANGRLYIATMTHLHALALTPPVPR